MVVVVFLLGESRWLYGEAGTQDFGYWWWRVWGMITSERSYAQILINELMASNANTWSDAGGGYDDWIELVNMGNQTVDLAGLYLTDDLQDLTQWCFPTGAESIIDSGQYLCIWADEDEGGLNELHCNFKLSAKGEMVVLVDRDGTSILDLVTFGAQDE